MRALGRRMRIRPRDIVLAVGVAVVQIRITTGPIEATRQTHHGGCWWGSCGPMHLGVVGIVLLSLGPIALLARRRAPRAVLAFVFAVTLAYALIGYPAGPVFLSLIVAFATVVIAGYRGAAWATIVLGWAVFLWLPAAVGTGSAPSASGAAGLAAWLLVMMLGAEALRGRVERRSAQQRARAAEGERRAEEERLRIARELHDVLAHNISLINVQSGVALHLLDERPEQARSALSIINEASADALREMRSVLGVLRRVDERAPRRPAAGLLQLPDLVTSAAAAGVAVQTRTDGDERELPTSVDLAAYRIVQESLTNVARHAGGGRATVSLRYEADALDIAVDDDGPSAARPAAAGPGTDPPPAARNGSGTGNGIAGMRERATALGGTLNAGPRPGGRGFRVRARLPYRGGRT